MHYICPVCKTENRYEVTFDAVEYICRSCSNIIDIQKNIPTKVVTKPIMAVVLEIGQKGAMDGVEYIVTGIIIRKYGLNVYWREYYLKDREGKDAFLSESDGHWVFLHPIQLTEIKKDSSRKIAEWSGRKYRWYETTQCHIHAAAGIFDQRLYFAIATYKEYVNGVNMISHEQSGSSNEFFSGKHISRFRVKKAFKISSLPNYSGIGIVQPFYINFRQCINIFAFFALFICFIQFYVVATRSNEIIFEQNISFKDVKEKELVSKTFHLKGGSAPLKVYLFSEVDNSWASVGLSLVNEGNNEIIYTSKDIEEYHGYEDGESWSEGGKNEEFNFCGIAPGRYHFLISAERQEPIESSLPAGFTTSDNKLSLRRNEYGIITVTDNNSLEKMTFSNADILAKDSSSTIGKLTHETFYKKNIDSLLNANLISTSSVNDTNRSVKVTAKWLPVSFWNFGIVLMLIVTFVIICFFGRRTFEKYKWKNSSNSPYPES